MKKKIKRYDEKNWIVYSRKKIEKINPITKKKNKNAGENKIIIHGYFPTLEKAIFSYIDQNISGIKNIKKFKKELELLKTQIVEILKKEKK